MRCAKDKSNSSSRRHHNRPFTSALPSNISNDALPNNNIIISADLLALKLRLELVSNPSYSPFLFSCYAIMSTLTTLHRCTRHPTPTSA